MSSDHNIVEQLTHEGHDIRVVLEGFVEPHMSPLQAHPDCNIGTMICAHGRYTLGDEQVTDGLTEVDCDECDGRGVTAYGDECLQCEGSGQETLTMEAFLKRDRGATVILPLGLLDHSGISMYVGAGAHPQDSGGWDSGQVGVIYTTAERVKQVMGEDLSEEQVVEMLRQEVTRYDAYLTGMLYRYEILDGDGDIEDSCGTYYTAEEAVAAAKHECTSPADEAVSSEA